MRPVDLNDAVRHAVELEAFHSAEKRHRKAEGTYMSEQRTKLSKLSKKVMPKTCFKIKQMSYHH